jgi:hypothetical protein
VIRARLRHGVSWSDTCILNISSRGLMVHTGLPIACGHEVDVQRGDHVIVATVVWRDGARAGLRSDDPVPIEQIVGLGAAPALPHTAASAERRKAPRAHDQGRVRGRLLEFGGVALLAILLAGAGVTSVEQAFARSLAAVVSALPG